MNTLNKKYGEWALITGASSGIGKEFAIQLAQQKFNLILVARTKSKLKKLAAELEKEYVVQTKIIAQDLSDGNFMSEIVKSTLNIEVGLVVNNAGFTITSNFIDSDIELQQQLIDVNIRAVMKLSHYFGNKMKLKGKGRIINVASASGFLPIPKWSTYAASKAFVLSFTEALWYELRPHNVAVLALCPGATKTAFNNSSYLKTGMDVEKVVKTGLQGLGKRPSIIVGIKNRLSIATLKFFSRSFIVKIGANIVN